MTNADKIRIVERATWEGVEQNPTNEVIATENWVQQTSPHAPTAFLNGVYRCEIDDESAPERVRAAVAHFRERKLPFRWKVGPSSRPGNLRALLEESGMALKETLFGLIATPGSLRVEENSEVRVEEVTPANLEDWLLVQASAWNTPPPGIAHLRRQLTEAFTGGKNTKPNYLAYYQGKPVGTAALRLYPSYAYLVGAAVNPDVRGRGIYRTLLAHRLREIERRGLPAVIHCVSTTSAPICLKLGFEKVCEIYSFEPKA